MKKVTESIFRKLMLYMRNKNQNKRLQVVEGKDQWLTPEIFADSNDVNSYMTPEVKLESSYDLLLKDVEQVLKNQRDLDMSMKTRKEMKQNEAIRDTTQSTKKEIKAPTFTSRDVHIGDYDSLQLKQDMKELTKEERRNFVEQDIINLLRQIV